MGVRGTENRRRDAQVLVRLTADEKAKIQKKAKLSSITVAEYLRRSALSEATEVYDVQASQGLSEVDRLALGELSGWFGRRAGLLKLALSKSVDIRDAELRTLLDADYHVIMEVKRSVDDLKRSLGS